MCEKSDAVNRIDCPPIPPTNIMKVRGRQKYGDVVKSTEASKERRLVTQKPSLVNELLGERSEPHTGVFNRDFA